MLHEVDRADPQSIAWRGLLLARWILIALIVGVAASVSSFEPLHRDLGWLIAEGTVLPATIVVVSWAVANLVEHAVARVRKGSTLINGVHLGLDVLAITALLAVSGATNNPFTSLYFVPLTLATLVSSRWTWGIAASCVVAFASLFALDDGSAMRAAMGPHAAHFAGHMRGMWYAFVASGVLMAVLVHRIAVALDQQRSQVQQLQRQALEDRHLTVVGAIAAGVAHELGTPLGSIQLIAEEMPHMTPEERSSAVEQIGQEALRCKTILGRMRTPELRASSLLGDSEAWSLADLLGELAGEFAPAVLVEMPGEGIQLTQPRIIVAQIVRELLTNAVRATGGKPGTVRVSARLTGEGRRRQLELKVRDEGQGMNPQQLSAAFEVLRSDDAARSGMGLGLYLSRAHAQRLHGRLELDSRVGEGSVATLELPLHAPSGLSRRSTTPASGVEHGAA